MPAGNILTKKQEAHKNIISQAKITNKRRQNHTKSMALPSLKQNDQKAHAQTKKRARNLLYYPRKSIKKVRITFPHKTRRGEGRDGGGKRQGGGQRGQEVYMNWLLVSTSKTGRVSMSTLASVPNPAAVERSVCALCVAHFGLSLAHCLALQRSIWHNSQRIYTHRVLSRGHAVKTYFSSQ